MGMIVHVFRDDYRSDINVFKGVDRLTVVNVDGPFSPTPDAPAAFLRPGPLNTKHVIPVEAGSGWFAFGGSYAATSDSRWADAVGFYGAVAIHDRDMSLEGGRWTGGD